MSLLELHNVTKRFGGLVAVKGVSARVEAGQIVGLIGANGAGKTTAMRSVSGLVDITEGRILFAGEPVERLPSNRRVERGISLVPEGRLIFPDFTVAENLRIGASVARVRGRADTLRDRMYELFPRLAERRDQLGRTLSGGEQQMLAIARVRRIQQDGVTVFIVEQNARQVLEFADYAYVLDSGLLALEGPARLLADDDRVKRAYLGL